MEPISEWFSSSLGPWECAYQQKSGIKQFEPWGYFLWYCGWLQNSATTSLDAFQPKWIILGVFIPLLSSGDLDWPSTLSPSLDIDDSSQLHVIVGFENGSNHESLAFEQNSGVPDCLGFFKPWTHNFQDHDSSWWFTINERFGSFWGQFQTPKSKATACCETHRHPQCLTIEGGIAIQISWFLIGFTKQYVFDSRRPGPEQWSKTQTHRQHTVELLGSAGGTLFGK